MYVFVLFLHQPTKNNIIVDGINPPDPDQPHTDFMASVQELVHSSVSQLLARKTFLGKYVCKYRGRTVAQSCFEQNLIKATQQKWIFFVLVRGLPGKASGPPHRSSPWHAVQTTQPSTLNAIMASYWWLSGAILLITVHSVLFDRFVSDFYSHRSLLWWYFSRVFPWFYYEGVTGVGRVEKCSQNWFVVGVFIFRWRAYDTLRGQD